MIDPNAYQNYAIRSTICYYLLWLEVSNWLAFPFLCLDSAEPHRRAPLCRRLYPINYISPVEYITQRAYS